MDILKKKKAKKRVENKGYFCSNCHRKVPIPMALAERTFEVVNDSIVIGCGYCKKGVVRLILNKIK